MSGPFSFPSLPPPLTHPPAVPHPIPASFRVDALGEENEVVDSADDWTKKIAKGVYVQSAIFEARDVLSFEVFDLPEEVLKGLYSEMSFDRPSEIQALSLPLICKAPYHSIVAQAQNGSGKTCCFVLCILTRLDFELNSPQALIVVPTRELAVQNESVVRRMGRYTAVTVISSRSNDMDRSRGRLTQMVVVSTMGTLQRWRVNGNLSFKHLKVVVFDEADVMLHQDSFQDHSVMLMLMVNQEADCPQILFFSATYDEMIKKYTQTMFSTFKRKHVQQIYVPREELSLDTIAQANVKVDGYYEKLRVVRERILPVVANGKTIIFVRTRDAAARLHAILTSAGWAVTAISGEMEFYDRDRVVEEFRKSVTSVLVATDVLSRGFDVFDVNVVINFDIPLTYETREPAYETYLHRVGRSGRFRRHGVAFNLVDIGQEVRAMESIANYFDREIPVVDVDNDREINAFVQSAGLMGV